MSQRPALGSLIAVYRGRPPGIPDLFTLFIPGAMVSAAPLLYGVALERQAQAQYGPVAADLWSRPWWYLSGLVLILFILLLLLRLWLWRRCVALYTDGLRIHLTPFVWRTLHFQELAGISLALERQSFLGIPVRTRQSACLYPGVGKRFLLPGDLDHFSEMVTAIKAAFYPRLLPVLRSAFHKGQWLSFKPLSLHLQELRLDRKRIPWEQVQEVGVRAGFLQITLQSGEVWRHPVADIPNIELLLQLVQEVRL